MKLAAIYNVWDGVELLQGSLKTIRESVDTLIIVYQRFSNYGEEYDPLDEINEALLLVNFREVILSKYDPIIEPNVSYKAISSHEINKRNIGIELANQAGCTHFLHMDCDEYYADFIHAKAAYITSGAEGSVCRMYTYFKHPTFRLQNPDNYFVPFIHKLNHDTKAGEGCYKFYVDPTRKINQNNILPLPNYMHHFSWIRKNIERKVRNSTARKNIEQSNLLNDYNSNELLKNPSGYFLKDYNQELIIVNNYFNIHI